MIKKWINEEAPHFPTIQVNYVGGDPRFIFTHKYLQRCEIDGNVVSEELEEKTEEINIKSFDVPMIESLLKEHGIERKVEEIAAEEPKGGNNAEAKQDSP